MKDSGGDYGTLYCSGLCILFAVALSTVHVLD